ncbi:PQQ-dependent sugar dehydrogenase [Streptomyces sp. TRM 70351]|uniref:PQQ-dependent sugar dehydrogenase n=1 Tax=Streptomyces sp. TRM 70351 TaxID=3116552 RepID=UPI002E7C4487|nr:PQQ-dependent sugar dehydrogenase [Streptomyces sp. TRM 70351]MEE1927340.1 PQQ-dependent sugar dehydrogenase [Streptomyces sp. TRM 70351]
MRRTGLTATAAATVLLTAACAGGPAAQGGDDTASPAPGPSGAASAPPTAGAATDRPVPPPPAEGSVDVTRTVATGLPSPWGLAPLPDGDFLVSSRDEATILRVDGESGATTRVGEVPGVQPGGEGGLLGIALGPGAGSGQLYAYFTSASDNRVVRMNYQPQRPEGQQLGAPDAVVRDIPKAQTHNGGRMVFGPDGMLYVGTGDAGTGGDAQDPDSLAGKILRVQPDGSPPQDGNVGDGSLVYSLGHRNVQGLAFDGAGRLWASEFGQNTWDEVNLIEPGGNYGWPEVEGEAGEEGFTDPVAQWRPEEASPSGLAWAEGSLWLAGLRGERLWRIPLDGTELVAEPQAFLQGEYGRLRTVAAADGNGLWLVTSNTDGRGDPADGDDRILELTVE